mgnify:FL=1
MEPEVRAFLIRIVNTISMGMLWMLTNATAGIKFGYAYPEKEFTLGNYIFYAWLVLSLVALIWYMIRLWSKPLNIKM